MSQFTSRSSRTSALRNLLLLAPAVAFCLPGLNLSPAAAGDWPMWRYDARGGAACNEELPPQLHLEWTRELPPTTPAWPDQPKLDFDRYHAPIVVGRNVILGSSTSDHVVAYDTRSGEESWVFWTDGPIRLPPAAADGRVWVGSDDGFLYCLNAASGALEWKFRCGPAERRVLGNERLVSAWPVRGGPAVADGVVYVAASIWPFMGTFIHALDAQTGEVLWTNDGDGSMYIKQPHNADSFAGVAPQGPLVVSGDRLIIPGGRSVPACYDRHTGEFLYYHLAANGKRGGGWEVAAGGPVFFNGGYVWELAGGEALDEMPGPVAIDDDALYWFDTRRGRYVALDTADSTIVDESATDRRGQVQRRLRWEVTQDWQLQAPGGDCLIKTAGRLYGGTLGRVVAIELPANSEGQAAEPRVGWEATVDGTAVRLLAADGRLFAVTISGKLYCFGPESPAGGAVAHRLTRESLPVDTAARERAAELVAASGVDAGYAVLWGVRDRGLIAALLADTSLNIIAVDPDTEAVAALRSALAAAGLYGSRISVHAGHIGAYHLPPRIASLLVLDERSVAELAVDPARQLAALETLRPYGGAACLPSGAAPAEAVEAALQAAGPQWGPGEVRSQGDWLLAIRVGAPEGSGNWTHEHADAANTRFSRDHHVRLPLGVLWFGGPTHEGILPRHGHGPQPQVVDGRLFIMGVDMLRAVDIYTGRLLWQRDLPGVGYFYDNTGHQPGANATGSNYVSLPDGIHVAYGSRCVVLDPASGETLREIVVPPEEPEGEPLEWGYINVAGDYVIAGVEPLVVETTEAGRPQVGKNENLSSSKRIVVLDRHSGAVLWSRVAEHRFRHNTVVTGGGRLYAVDHLSQGERARMLRRGESPTSRSRLVAFDLASGEELWSHDEDIFGTWLGYSVEHDLLVESGRPGRDTLSDEPVGMRAYRADDGTRLWDQSYAGPPMIHGDTIYLAGAACSLLSGEPVTRTDPVTGAEVPWQWVRNYGCNAPMGAPNLLTFRSGAAGYYDLLDDGGTGNFGGFRSGCTNNLVVAGGVLSAPDYTRTCVCSYQNQTSLGLVHMPEVETWTLFKFDEQGPLAHLALNLGAPGCRRTPDGRLWVNAYRHAKVEFDGPGYYNRYLSRFDTSPAAADSATSDGATSDGAARGSAAHRSAPSAGGLAAVDPAIARWVGHSGCRGIRRITVDPQIAADESPARFTLRLYFADPDNSEPGRRQFHVWVNDQCLLADYDPAAESGGQNRAVTVTLGDIVADGPIELRFEPVEADTSAPDRLPLLCGLEVVRHP